MEHLTDEEAWRRVLAGESSVFGNLWDRHRDRILSHLVRLEPTHADAEDLTAVVFLELWRHRRSIRFVEGSMLPWLFVTAQNVHRNAARARRRYRALISAVPASAVTHADVDEDPRSELISNALATCKGTDQDLLLLTAIEGYTVGEAAQALGLTEPAARMRLSRLRTTIRTAANAAPLEGGAS